MFRSIRWRITLPFAALIGLAILALGAYLSHNARTFLLNDLQSNLLAEARLVIGLVEDQPFTVENAPALDAIAKRWAAEQQVRITMIARDGTVLGESEEDRTQMENHADRPEVVAALADGTGASQRLSTTLGFDLLYVAVAVERDGERVGVIRLALPLEQVEHSLDNLERTVLIAALVAAALSVLLADVISRLTVRPLRGLTEAAQHVAAGEPFRRQFAATRDEVGDLARALNTMAEKLRGQIEELNAEQVKLSTILQQMESGVMMVDETGRIALINAAAERIFGIEADAAIGRSLVETLRLYQIVDIWQKARDNNVPETQSLDLVNRGKTLQVIATPLGGTLSENILLIFQDLTRVRRLETIRRDFISNISHELRTPLASLKALTETLLDGALDDPPAARRFLTRIETEVDSLSLMVAELLELARIESGRVPLKYERIAPNELIRAAVDRLYLQAERAGLTIEVHAAEDLPSVRADPPRMQQVLMNLLHNAIKFTPVRGSIVLFADRESDGFIRFGVRDTGVGIPADDLPRIFERFFKADRARSSGGTGLGLAISKHLVETHGGQIWAESVQGRGSTFYFTLPVA